MQIIVTFGHLDESHNSIGAINTIKKAVLNVFLENESIKRFLNPISLSHTTRFWFGIKNVKTMPNSQQQ